MGVWRGQWENSSATQFHGQYYLTIQKVEGDQVFGKSEFTGNNIPWYTWQGRLEGNVIKFSEQNLPTELTAAGDSMTGWVQGRQARVNISVRKQK